jgi:hypothetical protein
VARFKHDEFASYYINPPGQHGLRPLGGPVAEHGPRNASTGAVVGGATGVALGGLAGAVSPEAGAAAAMAGAGVGAYVGSLYGALNQLQDNDVELALLETPMEAGAGPMVAICIDRPGTEQVARAALNRHGAHAIERQEGRWEAGDWKDFDPELPADNSQA